MFLLLVTFITKIKVIFEIYHKRDNDHIKITFRAWFGLIRYKITIPLFKIDDNSPTIVMKEKVETGQDENIKKKDTKQYSANDLLNSLSDYKEIVHHIISLHHIVRHFLSKVSIKNVEWHTVVGLGDAAHTGMITGAVWALKGSIIAILSKYLKLKGMPKMSVNPHFQMLISQTSFRCMIEFRSGHAIFAGIKLVKFWKGGMPSFKSKGLSKLSVDKTKSL